MTTGKHYQRQGFLLLEMILALAVFAMAATGFVVALQKMSQTSALAQSEMRVTRVLDSAMSEVLSLPTLEAGGYPIEGYGIEVAAEIEPVEGLTNEDGEDLKEIFRIQVTARWYESGGWNQRTVETWRYGPMYQP